MCSESHNGPANAGFHIGSKGILSVFFRDTGLTNFIDTILPKERDHNIKHGESLLSSFMVAITLIEELYIKFQSR
jgi:hypothetical protein